MIDTLYLHIGAEKTGSTTLQHYLADNASVLKQHGWLIPEATRGSGPNHNAIAAYALNDTSTDSATNVRARLAPQGAPVQNFRRSLEEKLSIETEAAGDIHSMVLSSEDLSRLFTYEEIERLKEFLCRFARNIIVIALLRRQDLLASSRFSTLLLGRRPQAKVFPKHHAKGQSFYDFESNIGRWLDVFGHENVRISVYPDTQGPKRFDTVEHFCGMVDLPQDGTKPTEARNVSMDAVTQLILRGLVEANIDSSLPMLEQAIRYGSMAPRQGRHIVSRGMASAFYSIYADANKRLFERLGMPDQGFSNNFKMYPTDKELRTYYRSAIRRLLTVSETTPN